MNQAQPNNPQPAQQVVIGSPPGKLDGLDRNVLRENLYVALAGLVVALFPFTLDWSTGNKYIDFALTILCALAFGFSKRFLQNNQRTVNVPPDGPVTPMGVGSPQPLRIPWSGPATK